MRLALRGSALPGRHTRRCSPPTASTLKNVNISAHIQRKLNPGRTLSSYVHESYIQTLETRILLAHGDDRLGAIARNQVAVGTIGLTARRIDQATNRQTPFMASLPEQMCELAGAATSCCQGSAPVSPQPLTAAAFRLVWLLGSGFENIKAGALFPQIKCETPTARSSAIAGKLSAQLLKQRFCVVHVFNPALAQSYAIGSHTASRFAFRVAFLASAEGRPNLSRGVVLLGVAGLLLGTLAAVPGCVKILRILFSSFVCVGFVGCSNCCRDRALVRAKGETVHAPTGCANEIQME